jgi:broad specificity polyphosphatase/5'/3'-nucleotidase SurE
MFLVVVSRYAPEKLVPYSTDATSKRVSVVVPVREISGAGVYVTLAKPSCARSTEAQEIITRRSIFWNIG